MFKVFIIPGCKDVENTSDELIKNYLGDRGFQRFTVLEKYDITKPESHPIYKFAKISDVKNYSSLIVNKEGTIVCHYPSEVNCGIIQEALSHHMH